MTDRHPIVAALVGRAMRHGIARQFNAIRLSGALPRAVENGPLIVCANHSSWWDPAVFAALQHRLFHPRHGYGPIDAHALKRYPLLERAGLIPLDATDPATLRVFLRRARRLLANGHVLWITAQGRFVDPRLRPIVLQSGVAHLARQHPGVRILPLAIEYPFWTESRPEILLRFGDAFTTAPDARPAITLATLSNALTDTMDRLATDAQTRDPARFTTLATGRAGVGGVYDTIRRVHAWGHGRRFNARHEA